MCLVNLGTLFSRFSNVATMQPWIQIRAGQLQETETAAGCTSAAMDSSIGLVLRYLSHVKQVLCEQFLRSAANPQGNCKARIKYNRSRRMSLNTCMPWASSQVHRCSLLSGDANSLVPEPQRETLERLQASLKQDEADRCVQTLIAPQYQTLKVRLL